MKDDLITKAPVPKAYMTMALPVVMGMVVQLVQYGGYHSNS